MTGSYYRQFARAHRSGRYRTARRVRYRARSYRRPGSIPAGRLAAVGAVVALAAAGGTTAAVHHAAPAASRPSVAAAAIPAGSTADLGPAASEQLANQLATARGWGGQTGCLDALWHRESGFQRLITNPDSGAFGEAQFLGHDPSGANAVKVPVIYFPGGSLARNATVDQYPSRAANSGDAGVQIRLGLGYIAGTYGTPCGAWSHETSKGWY